MIVGAVLLFLCAGNLARGELCGAPADIVFMIDTSRSIPTDDFVKQIEFVNKLIDEFEIAPKKIQVAAVKFSEGASRMFSFDPAMTKDKVKEKITAIRHDQGGRTDTGFALQEMRTMFTPTSGHRAGVPKIGILLTDGNSTGPSMTLQQAKESKEENITIIAIGVGQKIWRPELEKIVTSPVDEHLFTSITFENLKSTGFIEKVFMKTCAAAKPPKPTSTTTTTTLAPTTPQDIQGDEPPKNCPEDTPSQILFGLFSVGGHQRVTVIEFIEQVWKFYFEAKADLEIGLIESCINTKLDLREYTSVDTFTKAFKTTLDRSFASFLKTMVTTLTGSGGKFSDKKQKTAILIVSGDVNVDDDAIMVANRFKSFARIIVISIGCNTESQLKHIAGFEKTGQTVKTHFFSLSEMSQLPYLLQLIIDLLCSDK